MNTKITENDVAKAIDSLESKGVNPSADQIRVHLGRGSKDTVLRLMKNVSADRAEAQAQAGDVRNKRLLEAYPVPTSLDSELQAIQSILDRLPISLAELQSNLFSSGRKAVENEMIGQATRHVKEIEKLQSEIKVQADQQNELTESLSERDAQLRDLTEMHEIALGELDSSQKRIVALEAQLAAVENFDERLSAYFAQLPTNSIVAKPSQKNGAAPAEKNA